jgi:DNA polymerase-3 subunit delta'
MNLTPINQTKLFGLEKFFDQFVHLYDKKSFPKKILLSGKKGIGKATLAYHLINYIHSYEEKDSYNKENYEINYENKSFKLMKNNSSPNFYLIDLAIDKKNIDINQVRGLINYANKSSFNNKEKIVLIDNIEFLNINSINALLKILEEPNKDLHFILINSSNKILPTLKSRCIDFKINLTFFETIDVVNKILQIDIQNHLNKTFLNHYYSPGDLVEIYLQLKNHNFDPLNTSLTSFLNKIIDEKLYKKDSSIKKKIFEYIQLYFQKEFSNSNEKLAEYYNSFIKKTRDTRKFNLDDESLFLEFRTRILNE